MTNDHFTPHKIKCKIKNIFWQKFVYRNEKIIPLHPSNNSDGFCAPGEENDLSSAREIFS